MICCHIHQLIHVDSRDFVQIQSLKVQLNHQRCILTVGFSVFEAWYTNGIRMEFYDQSHRGPFLKRGEHHHSDSDQSVQPFGGVEDPKKNQRHVLR